MNRSAQQRSSRSGYALLAILFAAAVIAVMLARSLPREAMSAQRIREENLIARGEQYTRGIQLYFREHKKYPEDLDDLEDTNGVRYLRKRYQDPITGEDEWRLIHMGANGRFKDSLIYDAEEEEGQSTGFGSGFGDRPGANSARNRLQGGALGFQNAYASIGQFDGAALARNNRESAAPDNPLDQASGPYGGAFPGLGPSPQDPNNLTVPADPSQPGPEFPPEDPTDYTQLPPGMVPIDAGQRPQPGQQPQGGGFGYSLPTSRGTAAGNPPSPYGQAVPGAFGGGLVGQQPGGQAALGGPPAGFGAEGINPQAANIIQRLLTTPRPGGLAGLQGSQAAGLAGQVQGPMFQEGIAGVASKAEQRGVKVYKGRETYNEWEFVYDYRADQAMAAGMPGAGMPMGGGGNLEQGQPGLTPGGFMGTPPGGMIPGLPVAGPQQPGGNPNRAAPRRERLPVGGGPPTAFPLPPTTVQPLPDGPGQPNRLIPGLPGQPFPQAQPQQQQQPSPFGRSRRN